jgi:ribose transport system substrate-binding protein
MMMKNWKHILLASVTATAVSLSAPALAEGKKIALVLSTMNNPFFVTLKEGAQAAAKAQGDTLVVLDSQNDPAKELANIEDLTVKGVDLILVNPTDSDSVVGAVMTANSAGIPVITLDRGANGGDVASHVASDNVAGGEMAARYLVDAIGGEGEIIQLEGVPGASASRDRGEGFRKGLEGSKVSIKASQPADFDRTKALDVATNMLQANPGVKAIFAQNDEMALGAARAAASAGRDLVIVGFDGTDEGMAAVKSGELAATVAQQASKIGELGVQVAGRVLAGETVDKSTPVELKLITIDSE